MTAVSDVFMLSHSRMYEDVLHCGFSQIYLYHNGFAHVDDALVLNMGFDAQVCNHGEADCRFGGN